jgi:hypothetical protein
MSETDHTPRTLGEVREYRVSLSGGNWFIRCIVAAAGAVVGVLMLVLLSGIVAVGAALAIFLSLVLWVRSWFRRQRAPNGVLDGRRNVRVVEPRSTIPN